MEAGPSNQQDGLWYNCIRAKYNFGCPHLVSSTTWYRHLQEVSSDEEQQCILIAKSQLHPPTNPPTDGRSRGAVGHRCNNVLPTQKQGREDGSHWDSADPEPHMHKRGCQQDGLEHPPQLPMPPPSPPQLPMPPPSPPQLPVPPSPPQQPIPPPSPLQLPGANIDIIYECRPCPDIDLDELECSAAFWPMSDMLSFIWALRNASITDPVAKLGDKGLDRLRNPPTTPLVIDNPGVRLSISTYLAHEHSSQASYERVCDSCKLNFAG
ncbi:hypothetical protein PAXRUDRAFT_88122, partial [Paxillus rubicundulus Ve08.2h10]